jgi:hypothetical protein
VTVSCDRCDYSETLYDQPVAYEFADGSTEPISTSPGWCGQCDQAVLVERLPEVANLEKDIAEIEMGGEYLSSLTESGESVADQKDWLLRMRDWRARRETGPKCLVCGSVAIHPFPEADPDAETEWMAISHPDCGGSLQARCTGLALMRLRPPRYTPEGDLIDDAA